MFIWKIEWQEERESIYWFTLHMPKTLGLGQAEGKSRELPLGVPQTEVFGSVSVCAFQHMLTRSRMASSSKTQSQALTQHASTPKRQLNLYHNSCHSTLFFNSQLSAYYVYSVSKALEKMTKTIQMFSWNLQLKRASIVIGCTLDTRKNGMHWIRNMKYEQIKRERSLMNGNTRESIMHNCSMPWFVQKNVIIFACCLFSDFFTQKSPTLDDSLYNQLFHEDGGLGLAMKDGV